MFSRYSSRFKNINILYLNLVFAVLNPLLAFDGCSAQAIHFRPFPAPSNPSIPEPLKPNLDDNQLKINIPTFVSPTLKSFPNIIVKKFIFSGNTAFSDQVLESLISDKLNKTLTFQDLNDITNKITKYYIDKGYINSGAIIPKPENQNLIPQNATINIKIIEGGIESIKIQGSSLLQSYIKHRLIDEKQILNINNLNQQLIVLKHDPLIKDIFAKLDVGNLANTALLTVNVTPNKPYILGFFADNYRDESIGNFERGIYFSYLNLPEIGGRFDTIYSNTDGSNTLQAAYTISFNKGKTNLRFNYGFGDNVVVQQPFSSLDFGGSSQIYGVQLRQIISRNYSNKSSSEFSIAFGGQHQELLSSILGFPFQISRGANINGLTQTTVFNFEQDWNYQDADQSANLSSKFNIGVNIGSVTDTPFKNGEFLSYQLNSLYTHNLPYNLLFFSTLNFQLANQPLDVFNQFALGGHDSVVGYPQDFLLTDNGIFFSTGLQIPLYRSKVGIVNLLPTLNFGYGWDDSRFDNINQTLASVGLRVGYTSPSNLFSASLEIGLPLIHEENLPSLDPRILAGVTWRF